MKKKIAAGVLAVMMLFTGIVNADSVTKIHEDRMTGKVTIEGEYSSDNFKPEFTLKIFDESGIKYITQNHTVYDNKTFKFEIKINAETGSYDYVINSDAFSEELKGSFNYFDLNTIKEALDAVNESKDADDIRTNIEKYAETLTFDMNMYNAIKSKDFIYNNMLGEIEFADTEELIESFTRYVVLQMIQESESADEILKLIKNYEKELLISEYDAYDMYMTLTDRELSQMCQNIIRAEYNTVEEFKVDFLEAMILAVVKKASAYGRVAEVLKRYESFIKTSDIAQYYTMSDTSFIDLKIISKNYNDINELRAGIKSFLTSTDTPDSSGGGGGNGGSTGGGYYAGVNNITIENNQEEKPQQNITFNDLTETEWAREAIEALANEGIINGKGDGIFDPKATITREEFVKILVNAFEIKNTEAKVTFLDVDPDAWYASYIQTAVSNGLVNGKSAEEFGVGEPITRQDICVLVYRFAKASGYDLMSKGDISVFTDRGIIPEYAKEAVSALQGYGIVKGLGNGIFGGTNNSTRAEAACIVYRTMELIKEGVL